MEALTRSGSGRAKTIDEYYNSGLPVDFRLIDFLITSLSGNFEIAEHAKGLLKKADGSILP
jgi:hypothetical protein